MSDGSVTIGALKRLTFLPERDDSDNGTLIAGQEFNDVYITGGNISNVTLDSVTFSGVLADDNVLITGGSINNTPIGNATPSTGAFTTASAASGFTGNLTGNVTGNLTGTASNATNAVNATLAAQATALQTARNINGTAFNGTADITITAAAGTLTGTALNATVTGSSLTSVGTLTGGTWNAGIIGGQYGGTGVNNGARTITVAGNLTHAGAFTQTFTATANSSVTLPTTGTLATLAGTENFTNKTLTSPVVSGGTIDNATIGTTTPAAGAFTSLSGSNGVSVGNTANASATVLDWYQEGTFTPVAIGTTAAGTGTYTTQLGSYTRIGNAVTIRIQIGWSAHTGTGNLALQGLPFTNTGVITPLAVIYDGLVVGSGKQFEAGVSANATSITLYASDPTAGVIGLIAMDTSVNGIYLSGTYFV